MENLSGKIARFLGLLHMAALIIYGSYGLYMALIVTN